MVPLAPPQGPPLLPAAVQTHRQTPGETGSAPMLGREAVTPASDTAASDGAGRRATGAEPGPTHPPIKPMGIPRLDMRLVGDGDTTAAPPSAPRQSIPALLSDLSAAPPSVDLRR